MNIIKSLKKFVPLFDVDLILKNETKKKLLTFLEKLQNDNNAKNLKDNDNAEDPKDDENVEDPKDDDMSDLIEIIKHKKIDKKIKQYIQDKLKQLIKNLEDTDDETIVVIKPNDTAKKNPKVIKEEEPVPQINIDEEDEKDKINYDVDEKELDDLVIAYNKYTENNPMANIRWNVSKKKWRLQYDKKDINSSELESLAKQMLEFLTPKNAKKKIQNRKIELIQYKTKKILLYNTLKNPVFDIQHVLNLLDIKGSYICKRYNEFKDKITHYAFIKNIYGGYILKEFIPENIMYELILSSNSKFAKSFKKDITKLLQELRSKGDLVIAGDEMQLTNTPAKLKNKYVGGGTGMEILPPFYGINVDKNSYSNPIAVSYAKELLENSSKIIMPKYHKQHVLYAFVMTLKDPDEKKNRILCKFGYSESVLDRMKNLVDEYKCLSYLVAVKVIKGASVERDFHKMLKSKYPESHVIIKIKNTIKDEIYVLDEHLMMQFTGLEDLAKDSNKNEIETSYLHICDILKSHTEDFLKHARQMEGTHILSAITGIANYTKHHMESINNYIDVVKNNNQMEIMNNHIQLLKDKENEGKKNRK
jgi:prophage antirepressor-like protein